MNKHCNTCKKNHKVVTDNPCNTCKFRYNKLLDNYTSIKE